MIASAVFEYVYSRNFKTWKALQHYTANNKGSWSFLFESDVLLIKVGRLAVCTQSLVYFYIVIFIWEVELKACVAQQGRLCFFDVYNCYLMFCFQPNDASTVSLSLEVILWKRHGFNSPKRNIIYMCMVAHCITSLGFCEVNLVVYL